MAILLDQAGAALLDESGADLYDELGAPETLVSVSVACSFQGRKSITATSATIGFKAGQPVQVSLTTLARDPWFQMYPG